MKRIIATLFSFLTLFFTTAEGEAQTFLHSMNKIEEGYQAGVSGAFTGTVDGKIIQAGGCNFPVDPLAPASQKKFYKGIYEIVKTEDGRFDQTLIGYLPHPIAYGLGISTPKGLVLIGGNDASQNFKNVYLLTINKNHSELLTLPSLPFSLDNFAVAYAKDKIYAGGGNLDGKPSNSLFVLDLKNIDEGWKELSSFPGNPRVQPVMAAAEKDGKEFLYIWGGFAGKGPDRDASLDTDGLRLDLNTGEWSVVAGHKDKEGNDVSLGGGAVTQLNDGRIVATGGVNKDIFLEALRNQAPDYLSHPIEWYKFNPFIFVFDPQTEVWSIKDETSKTARAGAGMTNNGNDVIYVLGGELKPRIRTSEVYLINF